MSRKSDSGLFDGIPLSAESAARLVANLCEIAQQKLPELPCSATSLTRIFDMGVEVYEETTQSEMLHVAVGRYLLTKQDLRPSSLLECRNVLQRMLRHSPELATRSVRSLRAQDCLEMMTREFRTPHTLDKARRLLNCFFNYALQQNWCRENPVKRIQMWRKRERVISALTLLEVSRLMECAANSAHSCCAPAVGVMLWAGVRPVEVARLFWADVNMAEKMVRILPRASKTGGARLVTMQPVLVRWLQRFRNGAKDDARLVPMNWTRRWRALREAAGLAPWHPDTLRHTFASYHLRYFRDIHRLQMEMGHSSARLLFSRYLNLQGLSWENAAAFWGDSVPLSRRRPTRRCQHERKPDSGGMSELPVSE